MTLRNTSLSSLIKIRDRGFKGVSGKDYDRAEIEREIKRKKESKGYNGFVKVRKS